MPYERDLKHLDPGRIVRCPRQSLGVVINAVSDGKKIEPCSLTIVEQVEVESGERWTMLAR